MSLWVIFHDFQTKFASLVIEKEVTNTFFQHKTWRNIFLIKCFVGFQNHVCLDHFHQLTLMLLFHRCTCGTYTSYVGDLYLSCFFTIEKCFCEVFKNKHEAKKNLRLFGKKHLLNLILSKWVSSNPFKLFKNLKLSSRWNISVFTRENLMIKIFNFSFFWSFKCENCQGELLEII